MTRQVTDRIEKKLEELESLDYTKSVTVAGQTTVFVYLRDTHKGLRGQPDLGAGPQHDRGHQGRFSARVIGPFFNDRFGDVFGNIYAFTSDGLSQRQLRDQVEDIRAKVLTVPNVGKVDILGAQDEVIYLEFSTRKIAALGLDIRSIMLVPAGTKRRRAIRRIPGRAGAHQRAGQRPVHVRGKPEGDQFARQRPLLSADGRRNHHARLCRSAHDPVPVQRPARDRRSPSA